VTLHSAVIIVATLHHLHKHVWGLGGSALTANEMNERNDKKCRLQKIERQHWPSHQTQHHILTSGA
jgi:hypothetical protein